MQLLTEFSIIFQILFFRKVIVTEMDDNYDHNYWEDKPKYYSNDEQHL